MIAHTKLRPHTPIILHEYEKKRLTEIAIRNRLILKGPFLIAGGEQERNTYPEEKKLEPFDRAQGQQAPAFQLEFSTKSIIPVHREKSRRTLREVHR